MGEFNTAQLYFDSLVEIYPNHPTIPNALFLIPLLRSDTARADSALKLMITDPASYSIVLPWSKKIALEDLEDSSIYRYIIHKAMLWGIEDSALIEEARIMGLIDSTPGDSL